MEAPMLRPMGGIGETQRNKLNSGVTQAAANRAAK
jgi:hypothetical protein